MTRLRPRAPAIATASPTSVLPVKEISLTSGMRDDRVADLAAGTEDDIEDARWQAGFLENLDEAVGKQRRVGGGLEDDGIPADERGHDLPGGDRHWEVPRRDQANDANRAALGHRPFVR